MVFVPMGLDGVCMDGVEASLFANPDCTGTRYGVEAFDDLPASFPDFVACHECDPDWNTQPLVEPTAELYACSVPGLRPAGFVSWFQAQRACENVGKHLCDMFALETACRGPSGYDYPYGPTFVEDACNTEESWLGSPVPTGNASCEGGFAGLFDLVGNVIEWTTYGSATNQPTYFGGSFDWADPTCSLTAQSMFSADELTDIGFRCCRVP
jgi:formylglycine-generating enzyme required for sulfatase activity